MVMQKTTSFLLSTVFFLHRLFYKWLQLQMGQTHVAKLFWRRWSFIHLIDRPDTLEIHRVLVFRHLIFFFTSVVDKTRFSSERVSELSIRVKWWLTHFFCFLFMGRFGPGNRHSHGIPVLGRLPSEGSLNVK